MSRDRRRTAVRPVFGRTPVGVYLLVALVGVAAVLATLSVLTPWYVESGEVPGTTINSTFLEQFIPGTQGYIVSCATFASSNFSQCTSVGTSYNDGNGTALLSGLYLGLLGGSAVVGVLALAGAVVATSGAAGRIRVRRAQSWVVALTLSALIVGAGAVVAVPALQPTALGDLGACTGFNTSVTPCNSAFGHANGVGCNAGTCVETDLSWHPDVGWYLGLGAVGLLAAALITLRFQPLGAPCPSCGSWNSFLLGFCRACGSPLPTRSAPTSAKVQGRP